MDLEATTGTRDDVTPGDECHFGELVKCYLRVWGRYWRPALVLKVERADRTIYYPWRFDWPVSSQTASRQPAVSRKWYCKRRWCLLAPGKIRSSQQVWKEARAELTAWYAAMAARKAGRP
jgi:hypothetical protein